MLSFGRLGDHSSQEQAPISTPSLGKFQTCHDHREVCSTRNINASGSSLLEDLDTAESQP